MNGMLYVRLQEALSKVSNLKAEERVSRYETIKLTLYTLLSQEIVLLLLVLLLLVNHL